ncbi:MAG: TIGR00269 family protein [Thermoplasmata archaeon]|nr:TIGR00269 family protein [Thermoplasmata archaeon]
MQCSRCAEPAVIDQPYASLHLCEAHFRDSVRERVRRDWHRQAPRMRAGVVAVALSGGKDSAVALSLTQAYFRRRPSVRLVALSVDEGIAGYRPATLVRAQELARSLGVEHRVISASSTLGTTTDEAAANLKGEIPCSFCGVWRRQMLNRGATELGADLLVLGFNLDDLAQTVLMNLARADIGRLTRMAPHPTRQPGLVPRIAPLSSIPEREVFLYARLAGLPFDHGECPHAGAAARNVYREVLWRLEEEFPGTRHSLLRTREAVTRAILASAPPGAPGRCVDCGEPAGGERCRACEYRRQMDKPLMEEAG